MGVAARGTARSGEGCRRPRECDDAVYLPTLLAVDTYRSWKSLRALDEAPASGRRTFKWREVAHTDSDCANPWDSITLPALDAERLFVSPADLRSITADDGPILFDTRQSQATFEKILVVPRDGVPHFYFVQETLAIQHSFTSRGWVDALAALPAGSIVHYLLVTDPVIERQQTTFRKASVLQKPSKLPKHLAVWYNEIVNLLVGKTATPEAAKRNLRQRNQTRTEFENESNGRGEAADEAKRTLEQIQILDAFLDKVRSGSVTWSEEEMLVGIPGDSQRSPPSSQSQSE
mmetsp:Transcript_8402/g.34635  ORF Transcript_8402/g.34635 Transcript_8402/m.34635 type:complete len:290 (+) Transcript_8402:288-1157(+)